VSSFDGHFAARAHGTGLHVGFLGPVANKDVQLLEFETGLGQTHLCEGRGGEQQNADETDRCARHGERLLKLWWAQGKTYGMPMVEVRGVQINGISTDL
jgi:hypothetical protein